jgi:hypothetical protein
LGKEIYIGFCKRWRNIPKPTIAAVQGKVVTGGLMLIWPCDIIIASDDAQFCDPVVSFGVGGVEFFAHPWEVGARKAKEMLFTSDWLSVEEAKQLGMVNQIVPREKLQDAALEIAKKITKKALFALKLTKEAVNAAEDAQGRVQAMQTSFALHQLAHTHWLKLYNMLIDPTGLPPETAKALGAGWRKRAKLRGALCALFIGGNQWSTMTVRVSKTGAARHHTDLALRFYPATPSRWPDIETLFGEHGACGGCWCMVWRLRAKVWSAGKGAKNKSAFKSTGSAVLRAGWDSPASVD